MEYLSRRGQILVLGVSAIVMLAILVSILYSALQAGREGEVVWAQQIITGTAVVLLCLGVFAALLFTPIFLMYVPTKKVYRRLRDNLPGSVVFMVTAPAHHSLKFPDNLNAPEIDLPFSIAAVFSASPEGMTWWTRNSKNGPAGYLPLSRIESVRVDASPEGSAERLVLELSDPVGVKILNVIDERSNGFRLRQPEDMKALTRKVENVLESGRGRDGGAKLK